MTEEDRKYFTAFFLQIIKMQSATLAMLAQSYPDKDTANQIIDEAIKLNEDINSKLGIPKQ